MTLNPITKRVDDVNKWVKRQFGDESGVQITDTDILMWLNQGQLEIANLAKAIQATARSDYTAGQFMYSYPAVDAIEVVALNINGIPIAGVEFQFAQEWIATNDPYRTMTSATPTYWWRFADKLYFWPTADTTYPNGMEFFYIKTPTPLVNSSDFLGLPDKYFEALVQYVLSKAYELDEDHQMSQAAAQAYSDRLGLSFEEDRGETLYYPKLSVVED